MTYPTLATAAQSAQVVCPVCLHHFQPASTDQFRDQNGQPQLDQIPGESEIARRSRITRILRVCPAPTGQGNLSEHTLPYRYRDPEPIVLVMVGSRAAGKSHLLASMVHRLLDGQTMNRLGITVAPLDEGRHQEYLTTTVRPFINERRLLAITQARGLYEPVDILSVSDAAGRQHTLVLFDIDGESMELAARSDIRSLAVVNALIYVTDPGTVAGLSAATDGKAEPSFSAVTDRVINTRSARSPRLTYLPTALVVAKADLLTYRGSQVVNQWMTQQTAPAEEFDLTTLARESEDVWAYLTAHGASDRLDPVRRFAPATLHFASAAGTGPDPMRPQSFAEAGFRQIRVLKPLLALLQAHGVALRLPAERPGRPAAPGGAR